MWEYYEGEGGDTNVDDKKPDYVIPTPKLIIKAIEGDVEGVNEILQAKESDVASKTTKTKFNVDCRDDASLTPLYYAVCLQHKEIVSALVAAGADVEGVVCDDVGESCMSIAVRQGYNEIVEMMKTGGKT